MFTPLSPDEKRLRGERLLQWFREPKNGGWLHSGLIISYTELHGFAMNTTEVISAPFKVATCPIELTLSYLNLDPSQNAVPVVDSPLQKLLDSTIERHVLSYLLLVEQMHLGTESRWYPYLACLPHPEEMTTPLWYTSDELDLLKHTPVFEATNSRRVLYQKEHAAAVALMKEHEDLAVFAESTCTFTKFLWAATIMTSRSFISEQIIPDQDKYPNFSILFPVIDLLNHCPTETPSWDFDPLKSFTLTVLGRSRLKDEELSNNYGPKMNAELLMGYGFCLQGNPFEQFVVRFSLSADLMEHFAARGWLTKECARFGIETDTLKESPSTQLFLRTKGNEFGRYANMIPFFRGIPPRMIHLCFLKAMWFRDSAPDKYKSPYPGARITLDILISLYTIVKERSSQYQYPHGHCKYCNRLYDNPTVSDQDESCTYCCSPVTNEKIRAARVYRNGQATIIHMLKYELGYHLSRMLNPINEKPVTTRKPLILLPREVVATLQAEFPGYYPSFKEGLKSIFDVDLEDTKSIISQQNEVWIYILVMLYTLWADSDDDGSTSYPSSIIYAWMHNLADEYPLVPNPKVKEEVKRDCERINRQLETLCRPDQFNSVWNLIASLNTMDEETEITAVQPSEMEFRLEVVIWAYEVMRKEHIYLDNEEENEGMMRLYLCPYGVEEEWVRMDVPDCEMKVLDVSSEV